ncbi:MAG: class I SAM-dependent methyltransferase [Acidobacteria bacterium]|nr:class I SAM-dependent methyltransferase [Acidobacteriota bacterium]MBV9070913.1 class I SAM-dependent methyltransferase [Acidobacteriota bacterium]MBV9188223.1 class I SAM-dependent methyltransferase [Acidobacteriota bacterium]
MFPAPARALLGLPLSDSSFPSNSWPLRDYVSPALQVVRPDACFPHMRPGDSLHHPWKYLRRDVPHLWYADDRFPLMGFLNRDEATLLHNIALQFAGKRALEIGSWLGWSTAHLALAGVTVDVIDPAHHDASFRAIVEESLACCGVSDRVNLTRGRSPDAIATLGEKWSLFFIDGDHESPGPARDALACLPFANDDCAFVFHDLASPAVAAGLRVLAEKGFHVVVYQTAQIMAMAWRGDVTPVPHVPDPDVAWQVPAHLAGLPVSGVDFKAPARSSYRRLSESAPTPDSLLPTPSVCIVSSEIIGPFNNGGIGTAMTGLAELLAGEGLRVTVLYTGAIWSPDVSLGPWRKRYAERGIELVALTIDDMKSIAGPLKDRGFGVPWLVYRYLAGRPFDIIHFNDCMGEGSLSLAAKRLGLAFADSLLVVALHSPSRWVLEANHTLPTSILFSAYHYAEKLSIACADMLWSPSRYLLDWVAARDFELPEQTFIQQYVIPLPVARDGKRAGAISEIVFFGRLEERKGLRLFCNAIHVLRDELAQRGITVTFLGKPERCAGIPSLDYIERRAANWQFPLRMMTELGQPEALRYLLAGGKLAVMASPVDNSPCTVYEALSLSIPFLAARTGGIPELIDAADQDDVLFHHSTESLAKALRKTLDQGARVATPAMPQEDSRRRWMSMHANWRRFLPAPSKPIDRTFTVAAIIEHHAGARLDLTLDSLGACTMVHRFVVLNRSGETLPLKNIDLLTADIEIIEDELTMIAEDAVLLIHSGVAVLPQAFDAMVLALESSNLDGLLPAGRLAQTGVSVAHVAKTLVSVPPLGGSAAFSLFEGVTFTGAMLMRRTSLEKARAGRQLTMEIPFAGLADLSVTHGEKIWPYPEVVVERAEENRFEIKGSLPARVAAYDQASSVDRYYMLAMGYGSVNHERPVAFKRELALAAVNMGLAPVARIGSWMWRRLRRWMH